MAKISVIVPAYKVAPYIRKCIDSIQQQTFRDLELLIIDDGSPDDCGKITDEYALYDERIIVIHKKNGGLSSARNIGLDLMKQLNVSEWVSFIDSDDWVSEDYLFSLLQQNLRNNTKISSCGTLLQNDDSNQKILSESIDVVQTPEDNYMLTGCVIWGRLYANELLYDIRFPVGKIHEDEYVTHTILFKTDAISHTPQKLYCYRMDNQSILRSPWSISRIDGLIALQEQLLFFKDGGYEKIVNDKERKYTSLLVDNIKKLDKIHLDTSRRYEIYREIGMFASRYYGSPFLKTRHGTQSFIFYMKSKSLYHSVKIKFRLILSYFFLA